MRAPQEDFRVRAADDPSSFLVLILDVSMSSWVALTEQAGISAGAEGVIALKSVTEQLLVFINSFLLLHEENRIAVILSYPGNVDLIYPTFPAVPSDDPSAAALRENVAFDAKAGGRSFVMHEGVAVQELRDSIITGVSEALEKQETEETDSQAPMSAALAKALCMHNRVKRIKTMRTTVGLTSSTTALVADTGKCMGRVLIVTPGNDNSKQYVPFMNCIFSAQRMGVFVDSCVLSPDKDSTYLQQAAYLTSATYLRPSGFSTSSPDVLLQYLQTLFLVDRQSRDFFVMPAPEKVDFRASCMETKKIIENGYTCSVCLSTFDLAVAKGAAMCPVCNARFAVMPRGGRRAR